MALKKFLMVAVVAALFAACGDDDSDFATRPSGGLSSACEDCDGSSSSKAKSGSSSSVTPQSSESETSVSSSSLAKSSSSDGSSSSSAQSSSSSVASSSSILVEYVDPSTVVKGTMTDERDGQTYKTVTIGTQTWMAENLNYGAADSCHNNYASNCTEFGLLYFWTAAMDVAGRWSTNGKGCSNGSICSPTYPVRGVCPEGWHLPTKMEWDMLFTAVGGESTAGKMLKSTSGWTGSGNGSDAYSFAARPAGFRGYSRSYAIGGDSKMGEYAFFWTSTDNLGDDAWYMYLYYGADDAVLGIRLKEYGHSVRCVKDE